MTEDEAKRAAMAGEWGEAAKWMRRAGHVPNVSVCEMCGHAATVERACSYCSYHLGHRDGVDGHYLSMPPAPSRGVALSVFRGYSPHPVHDRRNADWEREFEITYSRGGEDDLSDLREEE
jgi:ribosomal protein L32